MSVNLVSPADDASNLSLSATELKLSYTGDLLPWEFWVNGEKKLEYPQVNVWDASANPAQLGYSGNQYAENTTYNWYIRYANYAETKTWNGSSWDFTGLVYDETETRAFTTCIIPDSTNPDPANGGTAEDSSAYPDIYSQVDHTFTRPTQDPDGSPNTPNVDIWHSKVGDALVKIFSNADGSSFSRTNLDDFTEYQWRIDSIMSGWGTGIGSVWTYTTDLYPTIKIRNVWLGSGGNFIVVTAEDGIYLSTDFGDNWTRKTPDDTEDTDWVKGICSDDGTYIIVVSSAGAIYRSANSGTSWGAITPAGGDTFSVNKLATSDDGQYMVIVGDNSTDPTESCYLSTDYGATWTAKKPVADSIEWTDCDISNDGAIIAVSTTSYFYISLDSGATWLEQGMASTAEVWKGLSISGDGTTGLIANTSADNEFFIGTDTELYSEATWAESALTSAGRALLDDANAAAQATTLGLGTTDSPTWVGGTFSDLTASGMVATNASKALESVTVGAGLDYTRPNLTLSHLGIEALTDPGVDKIMFWDDSASACKWLGMGNSITITDVTIDTIQDIRTTASPIFSGLSVDSPTFVVNATGYENRVGIGTATPIATLEVHPGGAQTAGDLVVDTVNKVVYVGRLSGVAGDSSKFVVRERRGFETFSVPLLGVGAQEVKINTMNLTITRDVAGESFVKLHNTAGGIEPWVKWVLNDNNAGTHYVYFDAYTADSTFLGYSFLNGSVGIGMTDPHSKLEVGGAISSATLTITASSDTTDVSGVNTVFINPSAANVIIGGFTGGVAGQVLYVAITGIAHTTTLENQEGIGGSQNIYLCDESDDTLDDYGGWVLICDGTNWYDCGHAKHI